MFKTMLVEDNSSFRQLVKNDLQSQFPSMNIIEAGDGIEAFQKIESHHPNLIVGVDTVREPDGLAMSSRNGYLSSVERTEAVRLQRNLRRIKELVEAGSRDFGAHCAFAIKDLTDAGWRVDYVAVRNQSGLAVPAPADRDLVVLGAAWLGRTRLIDNLEIRA